MSLHTRALCMGLVINVMLLALTSVAPAQNRPPIEKVMCDIQARYRILNHINDGGFEDVTWPNCPNCGTCPTCPPKPPTGWYGDDLSSGEWVFRVDAVIDAIAGLDGEFLRPEYAIQLQNAGTENADKYYNFAIDAPGLEDYIDDTINVDHSNYAEALDVVAQVLTELTYLPMDNPTIGESVANERASRGTNLSYDGGEDDTDCQVLWDFLMDGNDPPDDDGLQEIWDEGWTNFPPGLQDIGVYINLEQSYNGNTGVWTLVGGGAIASRGRVLADKLWADSNDLGNGTIHIFVKGEEDLDGIGPAPAPSFTVDGTFKSTGAPTKVTIDYVSELYADIDTLPQLPCGGECNTCSPGKFQGWSIVATRAFALVDPNDTPDQEEGCAPEPDPDPGANLEDGDGNYSGGGGGESCGDLGAGDDGGWPTAEHPVSLGTGHKIEHATDLVVRLTGPDWKFIRAYSSDPALFGVSNDFGFVGANWSASAFRSLQVRASGDEVVIAGPPMHEQNVFFKNLAGTRWEPKGSATQYVIQSTVQVGTTTYNTWRLIEPGAWEWDFYRDGVDTPEPLEGKLLRAQDIYGNSELYTYTITGPEAGDRVARVDEIRLNPGAGVFPEAVVDFEWLVPSTSVDKSLWLKLLGIEVTRFDDVGVPYTTQTVDYTYKEYDDWQQAGDIPDDVGTIGDLILVKHSKATDSGDWVKYTHYRYHRGDFATRPGGAHDERLYLGGERHQLKAVVNAEQIEYYLQETSETIDDLLEYEDDDTVDFSGANDPILIDLAGKIISYRSTTQTFADDSSVEKQFLQSSCGCSGSATQGIKLTYKFNTHFDGIDNLTYETVRIREVLEDEATSQVGDYEVAASGQDKAYRRYYYYMADKGDNSVPYLALRAVAEGHFDDPGNGLKTTDSNRKWVTYYEYDSDQRIARMAMPSAIKHWNSWEEKDPLSDPIIQLHDNEGLVHAFAYSDDNRVTERRLREGYSATFSDYTIVSRIDYGEDVTGERLYLPEKIERFNVGYTGDPLSPPPSGDDVEVTTYTYGFHADDQLAYVASAVEAETVAENGPAGTYTSHALYDERGRNIWLHAADDTLTYREFNGRNGQVAKVVRNADPDAPDGDGDAALDGGDFDGISTTGWGNEDDGGELTTTYAYDLLGRLIQTSRPGNVHEYVYRAMVAESVGRPGINYYSEITLPLELSDGSFNGPAVRTWYDADHHVIRRSSYEINDSQTYTPETGVFTLGEELTRQTTQHLLSGLVESRTVWHDIQNEFVSSPDDRYETKYEYDRLGRVATVTNQVGTITRRSYDVLNRVIEQEVGTDDDDQTGDMVTVHEVFYDHDPGPVQGVGDGNVTLVRLYTGEEDGGQNEIIRDTETEYDFRNRAVKVVNPMAPHAFLVYDNMDRVIEHAVFESEPSGIGTPSADRGTHTITSYSQRGFAFRQQFALDPTDTSTPEYLESNTWFDEVGRVIASWSPNGAGVKRDFDAHGRVVTQYLTDRRGDDSPGTAGSYADASDVSGDWIIEQVDMRYDDANRAELVTSINRLHGDSTTTGALTASDGITTYVGYYFDDALRRIRTVNFGTNDADGYVSNGIEPTWPPASVPDFDDAEYDTEAIVTAVSYNARGLVDTTTDPTGSVNQVVYDDMNRRIATIESQSAVAASEIDWSTSEDRWYLTDTPATNQDRVTSFVYDGLGKVIKQIAHIDDAALPNDDQITEYVYGVTKGSVGIAADSLLGSNDLLAQVIYPDTEASEADHSVYYAYNKLGESRAVTDQNDTEHAYERDDLGRVIADRVTLGQSSPIDDAVLGIGVSYDDLGRVHDVQSYDGTDFGTATVVNGVEFTYTPFWQVEKVYQDHAGAVTYDGGGSPTGDTQAVIYAYDDEEVGTLSIGNHSRVSSMTYPDGTVLEHTYGFGAVSTLDDRISRTTALKIQGQSDNLVEYHQIGGARHAIVDYPIPDVRLDRTKDHVGAFTSGEYPGWDQWGRVVRQVWADGDYDEHATETDVPNQPPIVEEVYAYDRDSNRTLRLDERPGAHLLNRDFKFAYDPLGRLQFSRRGVENGSGDIPDNDTEPGGHEWELDLLGNWNVLYTDSNGDGDYYDAFGDSDDTRTHNDANELTKRIVATAGATTVTNVLTQDKAGNRATEGIGSATNIYVHDAWNRLVRVDRQGTPDMAIGEYEYNGIHWRTVRNFDDEATPDGIDGTDDHRVLYYDASWRLLEEHIERDDGQSGLEEIAQQFWGLRYIDDAVHRRRDTDADGSWEVSEPKFFQLTDAQFSSVAIVDEAAALQERVVYEAYGKGAHRWAGDVDGDGDVDSADRTEVTNLASGGGTAIDDPGYKADADLNRDGTIDSGDTAIINAMSNEALLATKISDPDGPDAIVGYDGYLFNRETRHYHVRFRIYDPSTGRWLERDRAGYVDGLNLLSYVRHNPVRYNDKLGWQAGDPGEESSSRLDKDRKKCEEWAEEQAESDLSWIDELDPCPCQLDMTDPDSPQVPCDAEGEWKSPDSRNGKVEGAWGPYHPNATWQVRGKPQADGSGQQCTYDENGQLITKGPSAGTPDRYSPEFSIVSIYFQNVSTVGQVLRIYERIRRGYRESGYWLSRSIGRHQHHDVHPFVACRDAGMLDTYFEYRPPSEGQNPDGSPCDSHDVDDPQGDESQVDDPQ